MRVVIVGSGRIGCGYLGPLFRSAGWEVVFATRDGEAARRIRRAGSYTVMRTEPPSGPRAEGSAHDGGGRASRRRIDVRGCAAAPIGDEGFARAVSTADLVCVSVGPGNMGAVAAPLALGLAARPAGRAIDVWSVENGDHAPALEAGVRAAAGDLGLRLPPTGFGGAVANVVVAHGSWRSSPRPVFVGDSAGEMWVDAGRLRTPLPALPGVETTRDYLARLHEKLHLFDAGHAVCAYLGWLRAHRTIAEAVADPFLRPIVVGSLLEARRALLLARPASGAELRAPVAEALRRFGDTALADPVTRVARDPIRKLSPRDRLLGPAGSLQEGAGEVPRYLSLGIAGALLYQGDHGEQTVDLRGRLARDGLMAVLESVCGLAAGDPCAEAVAQHYRGFIVMPGRTLFPPVHASPGPSRAPRGRADRRRARSGVMASGA